VDIPVWGALLEGDGYRVLVDTGLADPVRWSAYNPCRQEADETLPAALAELGWQLSDIDIVINSHLHYDHCENNPLLGQARFFVSQTEWAFAQSPTPSQAWSYDAAWTGPDVSKDQYTLIGVDNYQVLPGLRVITTPGHTPGHQSVLVDTAQGVLCVAGDAACLMENISGPIPPAVNTSVERSLASISKICALADRVLMNHDPCLAKFQSADFPELPPGGGHARSEKTS
jgi:N-acyl homoserine lactone hydrolase